MQVLRSLAMKIGLNEAIVLQQAHYLSLRNAGWVEKSIREWHKDDFPFWGEARVETLPVVAGEDQACASLEQHVGPKPHTAVLPRVQTGSSAGMRPGR